MKWSWCFYVLMCSSESLAWERVKAKGDVPPGTAAHSAVALGRNVYVFGGMTADGASNSMYRFQSGAYQHTFESRWCTNRHSFIIEITLTRSCLPSPKSPRIILIIMRTKFTQITHVRSLHTSSLSSILRSLKVKNLHLVLFDCNQ